MVTGGGLRSLDGLAAPLAAMALDRCAMFDEPSRQAIAGVAVGGPVSPCGGGNGYKRASVGLASVVVLGNPSRELD